MAGGVQLLALYELGDAQPAPEAAEAVLAAMLSSSGHIFAVGGVEEGEWVAVGWRQVQAHRRQGSCVLRRCRRYS